MTSAEPPLSVIIPWYNRPEIGVTLRENKRTFTRHGVEVVVVNCGGDGGQLGEAFAGLGLDGLRCVEVESDTFNKSLALNLGVYAARAERLFFLDTDIVLGDGFIPAALGALDETSFVTADRVHESRPGKDEGENALEEFAHVVQFVAKGGRRAQVETNRVRFTEGSRSGPGLAVLARRHFLEVDGMNSDLEGWGWEDLDLLLRLQFVPALEHRRAGAVTHLTHGDTARAFGGQSQAAREQMNFASCFTNYRAGYFYGTYTDDLRTWAPRLVVRDVG
ncbi:MAG: glycosyltransferase family 2 protein [Acidobacteria bacterium]|nr:glycosyltransferase family 2 protein [Acidobacteriota bacterium]MCA1618604.1 glycosyltransferase family 2 protein [Acidobacteriota bacterium]